MANSNSCLSDGALELILQQKRNNLVPLVQLLGTKEMTNGRVRAVISDGKEICQHCIFLSEQAMKMYKDGHLSKFTIIRVDEYTISSLPKNANTPVILVNEMSLIKQGEEIDRKLGVGESWDAAPLDATDRSSLSVLSSNVTSNSSVSSVVKPKPTAPLTSGTLKSENVCPLTVLTPFYNAWVIRVRVTNKSVLRTYANKKGDGKLFNFDVVDESGEIRITAFNAECEKYYDFIEPNKIYLISRGSVKSANKKFSSLNNDYEITLNSSSVIEECLPGNNDDASIPKLRFKFIPLSEIANTNTNTTVDVIGVIREVGEPETLISKKTQKELVKKEIAFVDKSLTEARVTMWNEIANNFEGQVGQILALKGVIVNEFRGKTLGTVGGTLIAIEPDIPETFDLRTWYDTKGTNESFTSLSKANEGPGVSQGIRFVCNINPKLVADNANLAGSTGANPAVYSSVNAVISNTNRSSNHLYKACTGQGGKCAKKLIDNNDGLYNCTRCDHSSPVFEWRLMLGLQVSDSTGAMWLTVFQETGEKLLGKSAQQLAELYEHDHTAYTALINSIRFKHCYFRIGSRMEDYNNEKRVRSSVYQATLHNPVDRSRRLMPIIDALVAQVNA